MLPNRANVRKRSLDEAVCLKLDYRLLFMTLQFDNSLPVVDIDDVMGDRVFGGVNGAVVDVHGAPIAKTWTLLERYLCWMQVINDCLYLYHEKRVGGCRILHLRTSTDKRVHCLMHRPAIAGSNEIQVKDVDKLGWKVGDLIGIATTSNQESNKVCVLVPSTPYFWIFHHM